MFLEYTYLRNEYTSIVVHLNVNLIYAMINICNLLFSIYAHEKITNSK